MERKNGLGLGLLVFGLGMASLNSNAQDVFGVDYIRKMENVNRKSVSDVSPISLEKNYFYRGKDLILSEPFEDEAKNFLNGLELSIYYPTNDCYLSKRDSLDIRRYVLKVLRPYYKNSGEKLESLTIEGLADCRGERVKNYFLSHKRAQELAKYIYPIVRNSISPSVKVYISAFGEEHSGQTEDSLKLQKDRVVKIIPNGNPLKTALDICGGNTILGDQSGSMSFEGSLYWKCFQNYKFSKGVKVFAYSEFIPPRGMSKEECSFEDYPERKHTYDINSEISYGATSYYPSKEILLSSDFVSNNDTITTIINGKNDLNGKSPDKIIEIAKGKNLVLNMVGLELSGNCVNNFIRIAKETGGKFYFVNKFIP